MPLSPLEAFAKAISQLGLTQAEQAIALLWFHRTEQPEMSVSQLAATLHDLSLTARVNISRLGQQLSRSQATVKGSKANTFKLRLAVVPKLTEKFGPFAGVPEVEVQHKLLPESVLKGTRRYLERFAWQLNGCYEAQFYDACAVLCRRLTESLLIEAFEKGGHGAAIKDGKDYKGFGELIKIASSGQLIRLSRNSPRALEKVKSIGDTAAHDRTYTTTAPDVDDVAHEFRRLVSELLVLADIHPKA